MGQGYGSTITRKDGIAFLVGLWEADAEDEESSNWREFKKVVEALEEEERAGSL